MYEGRTGDLVRTYEGRTGDVRGMYGGLYGDFRDFVRISYGFRTDFVQIFLQKYFFEEKDAEFQGNVESIEKFRYLKKKKARCRKDFSGMRKGFRTDVVRTSYGRTGDLVRTYGGSRTDFVRTSYGFLAVLTDTLPLVPMLVQAWCAG